MIYEDEKNIHAGHRERLLDVVIKNGIENISPIQQVEYFLTFIFPRGDVNPLAHRLLDHFGTFSHILDADAMELIKIKGINDRSAKKISTTRELFYLYATAKMGKKYPVSNKSEIIDVVEDYLRFRNTENILLLGLSAGNVIMGSRRIDGKSGTMVKFEMLDITNFLSATGAVAIVIAHNHPGGLCKPSEADVSAFKKINDICYNCGVRLIDSYIVGDDGIFSQNDDKIKRNYFDVSELKAVFKN